MLISKSSWSLCFYSRMAAEHRAVPVSFS